MQNREVNIYGVRESSRIYVTIPVVNKDIGVKVSHHKIKNPEDRVIRRWRTVGFFAENSYTDMSFSRKLRRFLRNFK